MPGSFLLRCLDGEPPRRRSSGGGAPVEQAGARSAGRPRQPAGTGAQPFELFRARSAGQVRALAWDGNPDPYLDLLSPYPLPASPLLE
jgi:hypothetical protein